MCFNPSACAVVVGPAGLVGLAKRLSVWRPRTSASSAMVVMEVSFSQQSNPTDHTKFLANDNLSYTTLVLSLSAARLRVFIKTLLLRHSATGRWRRRLGAWWE